MDPDPLLQDVFGLPRFRSGQREVIDVLLAGRPALAVFPTGGGKSLCYQLPALMLEGLTLVVSPLIALMKDQVSALRSRGIRAAQLDSTLGADEVGQIYAAMDSGELKLLYVAPERLANEAFLGRLRRARLSLLAIDEAHCISAWGHNFRPDYLKLGNLARDLKIKRVLALTATATPRVAEDIRQEFGIHEDDHIQTGFHRPNLHLRVTPCEDDARKELLFQKISERPPGAAIVYVTLQRTAEEVATFLARRDLRARAYHAGLGDEVRSEVQEKFMEGEVDIVVATIAFGMGIDKADIRYIYHYNLPKSLENYAQEIGRAGRDGAESICEVLACGDDRIVLENFVFGDTPTRQALRSLVERLVLRGDEFDISRYDLAATNDIRPLVVATVLAQLELRGLLIPRGVYYASYKVRLVSSWKQILAGHKAGRQVFLEKLFGAARKGRTWYTVDVETVASKIGEPSERIRKALGYLADMGEIVLQPSGLRHAFQLDPEHPRDVAALTAELEEVFADREAGEIRRIGDVIAFCETADCLTRRLLRYFGEDLEKNCGTCGNCRSPRKREAALPCSLPDDVSPEQVALIRSVMNEKHAALRQPRQLTRFLCGIGSPAASRARLTRHDDFGALEKVPFEAVLTQVETMLA